MGDQAISLSFQSNVRVAGETISGHVDINHTRAEEENIKEVLVKLIGRITTYVKDGDDSSTEKISLIDSKVTLWARGSSSSAVSSGRYPFQFVLPSQLPPSFYHSRVHLTDASIKYFIKVIGKRGLFRFDHYIRQVFPVVPAASPSDISNKALLVGGWNQSWESFKIENYIRTWPWESYSFVYAELTIPALSSSFPLSTPIPFRLRIVTATKSLKLSEAPTPPMFPAPPTAASQIVLRLIRQIEIRARCDRGRWKERVTSLGGMGDSSSLARVNENFQMRTEEPVWIPRSEKTDRGRWRRRVCIESSMTFSCPPSFEIDQVKNKYGIHLRIPFPGLGNDLKCDFPITINSGVGCSPPSYGMVIEFPPSYWTECDEDEKK